MLYRFEKGDSANDAADEICTVYGSDAATIKDLKMAILTRKTKVKAAAQQRRVWTLSRLCSLKIRDTACKR